MPFPLSHRWAASADEPISLVQYYRGNGESEGFSDLQVNDELDFCVRLHREIRWPRPFANLVHQADRLPARGICVWPVARQSSALLDIKCGFEHGRDTLLGRRLQNEPLQIPDDNGRRQDAIHVVLADLGEERLRLCPRLDHLLDQHKTQAACCLSIPVQPCHARGIGCIVGEEDPAYTRDQIPKHFEALWPQVNGQVHDARDVATRLRKTLDKPQLYGIAPEPSDDNGDAGGRLL